MGIFFKWRRKDIAESAPKRTLPRPLEMPTENRQKKAVHGTVSIMGNKVIVTDPNEDGAFATIEVPEDKHLKVLVDRTPVTGQIIVNSKQNIQVSFNHEDFTRTFKASVSEDEMTVFVTVSIEPGTHYSLKELFATGKAVFELEETEVLPPPCDKREIFVLLREENFTGKIDDDAISELCNATSDIKKAVVHGIEPTPCTPAYYERVKLPEVPDELQRFMKLNSVKMGTTLAHLRAKIPGTPGKTVRGEEIPVKDKGGLPSIGSGILDLNGRLVAARNGRFTFGPRLIDVVNLLEVDHDVTPADGLIEFDGDVHIKGSVLDDGFIKASGKVVIDENVYKSKIIAEQGVYVKGSVTSSTILTGQIHLMYSRLQPLAAGMLREFVKFITDYNAIAERAKLQFKTQYKLGLIPSALLDNKYQSLNEDITEFCEGYEPLNFIDAKYRYLARLIRTKWTGVQRTNISYADIEEFSIRLSEFGRYIELSVAPHPAHVRVGSVSMSKIHATGNIIVFGSGIYSSHLESAKSVLIKEGARGCFIVAERSAYINELGSEAGAESSVSVKSSSGRAFTRLRYPNTLLEVGSRRSRTESKLNNFMLEGRTPNDYSNGNRRRFA